MTAAADSSPAKSFVPCKVCGDKASGYHYEQQLTAAADSSPAKSFVPCKVCGDKASGYHY
ncbi:hypothetical protein B566_EDAN016849, partial [Ephemera danica]